MDLYYTHTADSLYSYTTNTGKASKGGQLFSFPFLFILAKAEDVCKGKDEQQ